jgi:hypothetical protein
MAMNVLLIQVYAFMLTAWKAPLSCCVGFGWSQGYRSEHSRAEPAWLRRPWGALSPAGSTLASRR